MTLYSRTGDRGFTMLPGPAGRDSLRIRKDDPRLVALGALDELNAAIGLATCQAESSGGKQVFKRLSAVQKDLLSAGSALAAIFGGQKLPSRLRPSAVTRLEKLTDAVETDLPKLKQFLVPGGCELAARLHLARTVARRAEQSVATALRATGGTSEPAGTIASYLNRLSDLLFVLARRANHEAGVPDRTWREKK